MFKCIYCWRVSEQFKRSMPPNEIDTPRNPCSLEFRIGNRCLEPSKNLNNVYSTNCNQPTDRLWAGWLDVVLNDILSSFNCFANGSNVDATTAPNLHRICESTMELHFPGPRIHSVWSFRPSLNALIIRSPPCMTANNSELHIRIWIKA